MKPEKLTSLAFFSKTNFIIHTMQLKSFKLFQLATKCSLYSIFGFLLLHRATMNLKKYSIDHKIAISRFNQKNLNLLRNQRY